MSLLDGLICNLFVMSGSYKKLLVPAFLTDFKIGLSLYAEMLLFIAASIDLLCF